MPRAKLKTDFSPDSVHTVTLFVPALFWPHAGPDRIAPAVPALSTLIGRGNTFENRCDDELAWLCQQFGVGRQTDWPSAPIALLGAGQPPGADFWLSADPVHLQVNRDQLIMLAPEALSITDAEASALCIALNRHFATDEITFLAPRPHRWYLKTAVPARIRTSSLSRTVGQDVDHMLPEGADHLAWHGIFNEVQMLLHGHPVNAERENRGTLPINSLWFSGGGTLPHASTSFQAVQGTSLLAGGLSRLAQIPFTEPRQGSASIGASDVLIELCDLAIASMRLDQDAWKDALQNLDRHWVAPLAEMLRKGRIHQLVIATVANGRSHQWSINRTNLWRWWRAPAMMNIPEHKS